MTTTPSAAALSTLAYAFGTVTIQHGIATLEDGTTIDLVKARVQQDALVASLREVIVQFQTGAHYETKNPYRRPYIESALVALKAFTGFKGDWANANDEALNEANKG